MDMQIEATAAGRTPADEARFFFKLAVAMATGDGAFEF
jgi:hypothetical protein